MLATYIFLRMNLTTFLSFCIDFAGELSGSHLVTSGLQLRRVPEEAEEKARSYTKRARAGEITYVDGSLKGWIPS
jgi:hypothetical protein